MSKDIILVYPDPSKDSPNRNLSLSILFPGAALEKKGFNVAYIDTRFDSDAKLDELLRKEPKAIGISTMTGNQCTEAKRIMERVKSVNPAIKTILGGVHPSMMPQQTLSEPLIDFIITGEGEETICELMEALVGDTHNYKDILGIGWKEGEELIINPKRPFLRADDLPFPLTKKNKHLFEIAAKTGHLSYFTSRGCPFRCSFCYNLIFNDRKWRVLSGERLEEDLNRLKKELDFGHIYFVDDYIGHHKKRISEVTQVMNNVKLTWHSSIRASDIDSEMAEILDNGNCTSLLFGLESASERMQQKVLVKDFKRGLTDVTNCVNLISKTSIIPLYSFMYNVPGETYEELVQTIELAEWIYKIDIKARIGFYAYTPYPGTPLYKAAVAKGMEIPSDLEGWGKMSLSNEENPLLRDLYYIAGLRFRGRKGDRTNENFPGFHRLKILPYELLSKWRWKNKKFVYTSFERKMVHGLISNATKRNHKISVN